MGFSKIWLKVHVSKAVEQGSFGRQVAFQSLEIPIAPDDLWECRGNKAYQYRFRNDEYYHLRLSTDCEAADRPARVGVFAPQKDLQSARVLSQVHKDFHVLPHQAWELAMLAQ